jgi:deoxyribodipyrimidine photo-lyase
MNHSTNSYTFFWHRRDLRTDDNIGLANALNSGFPVIPVFIFDTDILSKLDEDDQRVTFIHAQLERLKDAYKEQSSDLLICVGKADDVWKELSQAYKIHAVYTNRDYEPAAKQRDLKISDLLHAKGTRFYAFKDQVIFDEFDIVKADQSPYTVFTPYKKKWLERFYQSSPVSQDQDYTQLAKDINFNMIPLAELGFRASAKPMPLRQISISTIQQYHQKRDFPAELGTSRLSVHLRFGTLSIRRLVRIAADKNETFLSELIWREFYMKILDAFPHVEKSSFKPSYDAIRWENDAKLFELWCNGQTGYPLVDAGMNELNKTGFMHNRVRMVVASFLTKHLLIDWRQGEAYFAKKLLDFDLSANNGGWQWAAGCGCDAAPYFRVFNPYLQAAKFDPQTTYIKKWIPNYTAKSYIEPIVEHKFARQRAIERYKEALNGVTKIVNNL